MRHTGSGALDVNFYGYYTRTYTSIIGGLFLPVFTALLPMQHYDTLLREPEHALSCVRPVVEITVDMVNLSYEPWGSICRIGLGFAGLNSSAYRFSQLCSSVCLALILYCIYTLFNKC